MKDWLKNKIGDQFKSEGSNMYSNNTDFIIDKLNSESDDIVNSISVNGIEQGKFYFVFYDLQGKSTKMEQFNSLFVIDFQKSKDTQYMFGISTNFLPIYVRTAVFNTICNYNDEIIEKNKEKLLNRQEAFEGVSYSNIYKMLYSIGFEWAIRQFDMRLINKAYVVNTNELNKFITMSTAKLTGVDDSKLLDIWKSKINDQEERHKKIINELLNDYNKLSEELTKAYKNTETMNINLEKSLNSLRNI